VKSFPFPIKIIIINERIIFHCFVKAGFTRIQARKLEHIATVVCSHRLGGMQEIMGICENEDAIDERNTNNVGGATMGGQSSSPSLLVSSSNSTLNSSRIVGTSLDRPEGGGGAPSELTNSVHGGSVFDNPTNSSRQVRKKPSMSNRGGAKDDNTTTVSTLSTIHDELNVMKKRADPNSPDNFFMDGSECSNPTLLLVSARKLAEQNKLGEATALCEKAVAVLTQLENGEDQIESMSAIGFLAELYLHRRRLDIACSHAEWLLRIKKRKMGEEDLSTADAMFLLGEIQKRRGLVSEAAVQLRWCLRVRESCLGEDHIKTAMSLHALGITTFF
jgi:hypothetical protein